jgi:hypothetical protein
MYRQHLRSSLMLMSDPPERSEYVGVSRWLAAGESAWEDILGPSAERGSFGCACDRASGPPATTTRAAHFVQEHGNAKGEISY